MSETDPVLHNSLIGDNDQLDEVSVPNRMEAARMESSETSNSIQKMAQFEEEIQPVHTSRQNLLTLTATGWMQDHYPRTSRLVTRVFRYFKGPQPPIISPAPIGWLDRTWRFKGRTLDIHWERHVLRITHPLKRPWIFWPLVAGYIVSLAFFARANYFFTPPDSFVDCTAAYWVALDGCGLDGTNCQPFNNSSFDFRCPAGCKETILQNIRTVGDEEVVYVPLVVGGGDNNRTYRGDSFLCAAGIHAGLISETRGGCATVSLVGTFTDFLSSSAHGIATTSFPSIFPLSYRLSSSNTLTHCVDLRNEALAFDILVTAALFLLLRPKPIVIFWCLVCIGFWHVNLFSDPAVPPDLSTAFGTFLPALFICYAFWRSAFRHVFPTFSEIPIERLIWYLPAYWAGVLFTLVTAGIPIDRLVGSDLTQRPGAIVALIICIIVITVLVINQIRVVRKTGWLPYYAKWYSLAALALLVLALLPGLEFRLHHYFAAILIIPITAFPTRLSAIYQAFCLGMFLNGAAKFGFDAILQTAAELRRDAPLGTDLPNFLTNSTTWNAAVPLASQILRWQSLPANESWDGYALLVDDVERYAGNATNFTLKGLDAAIPHFFRLAFQDQGTSGDFTKAAVLYPNGTWVDPASGPS